MAWWCFDEAVQYFEEILLVLKTKTNKTNKKKRVDNGYWISDVLVQHEYLDGVSVHVNVCGAAEAPEEQVGKWTASKSSLAKVLYKVDLLAF